MSDFQRLIVGGLVAVCLVLCAAFPKVTPDFSYSCGSSVTSLSCDGAKAAISQGGVIKLIDFYAGQPVMADIGVGTAVCIKDGLVVWESKVAGYYQIFVYNIFDDVVFQATSGSFDHREPAVSNNRVVFRYKDSGDSILHIAAVTINGNQAGAPVTVCNAANGQYLPAISENTVLWHDSRNYSVSGRDIYMYNFLSGQEALICAAPYDQKAPFISGDIAVWQDYRNSSPASNGTDNSDIYAFSISKQTELAVCTRQGNQFSARCCGNLITWVDESAGFEGVYVADIASFSQYPVVVGAQQGRLAALSADLMVWYDGSDLNALNLPIDTDIKIVSPVAGGSFYAGKYNTIQWENSQPQLPVDIKFSPDGGQSWQTIASGLSDTLQYSWLTGEQTTDSAVITVSYTDIEHIIYGSGVFSIVVCDKELTADISGDCFVGVEDLAVLASQWMKSGI